ncbi:MAG: hypothetical protein ACTHL3_06995 [Candidatus Nitrosocosmicus sp.]
MKRNLETLEDFIKNVHKLGYTIISYNDIKIPVLYVNDGLFDQILNFSYSTKTAIDTNLNIYDDGYHIFVDINLKFLNIGMEETFLLYANETLDFFYHLANAGMFGLVPNKKQGSNVFFIQLPKKDRAEKAFNMIDSKLKKTNNTSKR